MEKACFALAAIALQKETDRSLEARLQSSTLELPEWL